MSTTSLVGAQTTPPRDPNQGGTPRRRGGKRTSTGKTTRLHPNTLRNKYGILTVTDKREWGEFKPLFDAVTQLGSITPQEWADQAQSSTSTWREKLEERAHELHGDVIDFQAEVESTDENSWRELELGLFRHLRQSSRCQECSQRQWHPLQPIGDDLLIDKNNNLKQRQIQRRPCKCRNKNPKRPNLLVLKNEQKVIYNPDILQDLDKNFQKPDTIVSLKLYGRVRKYLARALGDGNGCLKTTFWPKKYESENIFPFFVSEAKSGANNISQPAVELQLAFVVREALLAQKKLALGPSGKDGDHLNFKPLVWYFTYRGKHCQLGAACLAFQRMMDGKYGYAVQMMPLWSAEMDIQQNILQLLLIMDYISDWARDVYRENIIHQLKVYGNELHGRSRTPSPARSEVPTIASLKSSTKDGDVNDDGDDQNRRSSLSEPESAPLIDDISDTLVESEAASHEPDEPSARPSRPKNRESIDFIQDAMQIDSLQKFDVEKYAFRDGSRYLARAMTLLITPHTIGSLINTTADDTITKQRLRRIVQALGRHDPLYMKGSDLMILEANWTDTCSDNRRLISRNGSVDYSGRLFYVICTFSSYMSPDWQPVREMCCLAVSHGVLKTLMELAETQIQIVRTRIRTPSVRSFLAKFERLKCSDSIAACLNRCLMTPFFIGPMKRVSRQTKIRERQYHQCQTDWESGIQKPYRNMVLGLYRAFFLGAHELPHSYLRVFDKSQSWLPWASTINTPWYIHSTDPRRVKEYIPCELQSYNNESTILCYNAGSSRRPDDTRPRWCLFFMPIDEYQEEPPIDLVCLTKPRFTVAYRTERIGRDVSWQSDTWDTQLDVGDHINIARKGRRAHTAFIDSVKQVDPELWKSINPVSEPPSSSSRFLQSPSPQHGRTRSSSIHSAISEGGDDDEDELIEGLQNLTTSGDELGNDDYYPISEVSDQSMERPLSPNLEDDSDRERSSQFMHCEEEEEEDEEEEEEEEEEDEEDEEEEYEEEEYEEEEYEEEEYEEGEYEEEEEKGYHIRHSRGFVFTLT